MHIFLAPTHMQVIAAKHLGLSLPKSATRRSASAMLTRFMESHPRTAHDPAALQTISERPPDPAYVRSYWNALKSEARRRQRRPAR